MEEIILQFIVIVLMIFTAISNYRILKLNIKISEIDNNIDFIKEYKDINYYLIDSWKLDEKKNKKCHDEMPVLIADKNYFKTLDAELLIILDKQEKLIKNFQKIKNKKP